MNVAFRIAVEGGSGQLLIPNVTEEAYALLFGLVKDHDRVMAEALDRTIEAKPSHEQLGPLVAAAKELPKPLPSTAPLEQRYLVALQALGSAYALLGQMAPLWEKKGR